MDVGLVSGGTTLLLSMGLPGLTPNVIRRAGRELCSREGTLAGGQFHFNLSCSGGASWRQREALGVISPSYCELLNLPLTSVLPCNDGWLRAWDCTIWL